MNTPAHNLALQERGRWHGQPITPPPGATIVYQLKAWEYQHAQALVNELDAVFPLARIGGRAHGVGRNGSGPCDIWAVVDVRTKYEIAQYANEWMEERRKQ